MCEVENNAKDIIEVEKIARNHGSSAVSDSIIKQYTVKFLEHTHTFNHMIDIEITQIVALNERISTLQK